MTIAFADHDGVRIAYESVGAPTGEPLLLIMGVLGQLIGWPDGFCAELHDRGFHVVRFDNRDVGQSTHLPRPADHRPKLLRLARPRGTYTVEDMAGDALAVMDDLRWPSAHVVGISAGGIIAQVLAARHGDRVRSLTSISSTASSRIGRMRPRTMLAMAGLARKMGTPAGPDAAADLTIAFAQQITGSPGYPLDVEAARSLTRRSAQRDPGYLTAGPAQTAAVNAAGDRRAELAGVTVPTLVIHGDADVVIRPEGGRATADAVPGAELVIFPGLGHELPQPLWPSVADRIAAIAGLDRRTSA
jgi:pimeloyl-ACP methyl ester carboxylesterase